MANPPTVGIVGAGFITQNVHLPVLSAMSGVRVGWVADIDEKRAAEAGRAFGIPATAVSGGPAGLPDADILLLTVPVGVREPYHAEWARRGAAVFAEKPFARSVEEHRRLMAGFAPSRIGCGFMRRGYAGIRALRLVLERNWFGAPRRVAISEGGRTTRSGADRTFLDDPSLAGGGVLIDYGSHSLDALLYATGASGADVDRADILWDGDVDRAVVAEATLRSPAGPIPLALDVSWVERRANRFVVEFDRATLTVGTAPEGPVELSGGSGAGLPARILVPGRAATTSFQAFYLEWREFLEGLSRGEPTVYAASDCLRTTAVVEAVYRAGGRA